MVIPLGPVITNDYNLSIILVETSHCLTITSYLSSSCPLTPNAQVLQPHQVIQSIDFPTFFTTLPYSV